MITAGSAHSTVLESAFQSFNVGTRVQLRSQRETGAIEKFSSLIGFVKDEYVMVKSPMTRNTPIIFFDGEKILVRAFTGTMIYSFSSTVIRTFLSPLYYMHLEYPKEMQSSALRSELRIKVDVPGEIEYQDLTDSRTIAQVQLVNLSLSGARISCEEFISVGQQLQLLFTVQSDDVERKVEVETIVRSADRKPASPAHDRDTYSYGLQFQNLNTQDQIAIRLLTYETLLTNRQNIA